MYCINKLRADRTIDFAAEELRKYLGMLMPKLGDIPISYAPDATEGFRLGLLEDFDLPNEAKDPLLDDVVHIDTTEKGGILAGSNPRSVLFAVYRFLRLNGCRWLFPGPDGEHIPIRDITPQSYHKMADSRYRGHTTEGDPSLEHVLDYIDYHAKLEQNVYGLLGIFVYHIRYYEHDSNQTNRTPEPVSFETVDQWKRLCEAELLKRGMLLTDGDHENMPLSVGMDPADRRAYLQGEKQVPEESKKFFAEIKGQRKLFRNDILFTNMCMSQKEWRLSYVKLVADYCEQNRHIDIVRVPLADGNHNHCECEECRKLRPSDFLVRMMNELDEELTRRKLPTRIVFSTYVDAMFAPVQERIKNEDRFFIQFTPITRTYTASITADSVIPNSKPYGRNEWDPPKSIEECVSYINDWRKGFHGPCYSYEYHFWRAICRDPGLMDISRRIYNDIQALDHMDMIGYLQDGTNRHFFPNAFPNYVYAEALIHHDLEYETLMEDYFSHCYGKDWKLVRAYLTAVSNAFGEKYMAGEDSADPKRGTHFNPARAAELEKVYELTANARDFAKKHMKMPTRPQTVCCRMLIHHAEYCQLLADVFTAKCKGYDKLAIELCEKFCKEFGKHSYELDRFFDFGLVFRTLLITARQIPKIEF